MQKRIIPACVLAAYSAILIKFVVFKSMPVLQIGHMRFKFAGGYQTGEPNFVPFKTIGLFLQGHGGHIIAMVNLLGNILPFVPIGFLVPFVYRKMTWQKSVALSVATGLAMEGMEVVFHVGIFDIDDVILNALGVMIGYWLFTALVKRTAA